MYFQVTPTKYNLRNSLKKDNTFIRTYILIFSVKLLDTDVLKHTYNTIWSGNRSFTHIQFSRKKTSNKHQRILILLSRFYSHKGLSKTPFYEGRIEDNTNPPTQHLVSILTMYND